MTSQRLAAVIVLAAGEGTRMRSSTPKVLHRIGGRSLLGHALAAARGLQPERLVVVVRHGRDEVAQEVARWDADALVAEQDDIPGTGRAAECGLAILPSDLEGTIVVTMGDAPLVTRQTLADLYDDQVTHGSGVTMLTAELADPTGYGRVVRAADGTVVAVVEQRDATAEQRSLREVNAGFYAFDAAALRAALRDVDTDNAQGEKYLTDVVRIVLEAGGAVRAYPATDPWEIEGVNDRAQLARLGAELNRRIVDRWMLSGVTVLDPGTTWIDVDVTLEPDVTVHPNTQILGTTVIARGASIGPDTTLTDTVVGQSAAVVRTHAVGAEIGPDAAVGPYASLRPGTSIGANGKVGTFVETKNAAIADGAKVPHLTYVGDADIGPGTNIGAGTIFANYDGVDKHRTVVGAECRTGANNTFVAPVVIGDGAATGAGTVVRRDVPPGALAVSTAPQRAILDWVHRKRAGSKAARAAEEATRRASREGS